MSRSNTWHRHAYYLVSLLSLALCTPSAARAEPDADEDRLIPRQLGNVSIDGGLTWFVQGTDGAPANTTALTYTLDLVFHAPVGKHGKAVVALEAGEGLGVDAVLKPLSVANYDAYYTNVTSAAPGATDVVVPSVSQAYYQGEYLDGRLSLELGKLDVHATYDTNAYANNETDQFISGMFVRSAGTSYRELDRYYAPGVALSYGLSKMIDITLVAANGTGSGFNDVFDYPYLVGQVNFKPAFAGRGGNYRFYAIADSRNNAYTRIDGSGGATNSAWGLSFDQAVADHVGLFARYSMQDDNIAQNVVKGAWSVGASLQGALWGREADAAGIGYGSVMLNHKANPTAMLGFADSGDESHTEFYYNLGLFDYLTLTADLQLITHPGGNAAVNAVTVAGIRGQINF